MRMVGSSVLFVGVVKALLVQFYPILGMGASGGTRGASEAHMMRLVRWIWRHLIPGPTTRFIASFAVIASPRAVWLGTALAGHCSGSAVGQPYAQDPAGLLA